MNSRKRNQGMALVEFSIAAFALFLVLFVTVDFGILLYNKSAAIDAARNAARWASRDVTACAKSTCTNSYSATPADACQIAYSDATRDMMSPENLKVSISPLGSSGCTTGTLITVSVAFDFSPFSANLSKLSQNTYTSTAGFYHE